MDIQDVLDMVNATPAQAFKDDLQAIIDEGWGAQTNLFKLQEEKVKGTFEFVEIEALVIHAIDTSTGQYKNSYDWQKIAFRELDHDLIRGRYYKLQDSYWIATDTNDFDNLNKTLTIRRCNNWLKWDGKEYPCCIEYEATSSTPLTAETLVTPNSNINIVVQANDDTLNLDLNQKFMIGNKVKKRPYKIINYVDYLQNGIDDDDIPLVYLTLQLVQKSDADNVEDEVVKDLRIDVTPDINELLQGRSVNLVASVMNSETVVPDAITCSVSGADESCYTFVDNGDNSFTLTNVKQHAEPLKLVFTNGSLVKEMEIKLRAKF